MSSERRFSNVLQIFNTPTHRSCVMMRDHLISSNNLLNPHQSAYCKHHSTDSTILLHSRSSHQCYRFTKKFPSLSSDLSSARITGGTGEMSPPHCDCMSPPLVILLASPRGAAFVPGTGAQFFCCLGLQSQHH